MKSNVLETIRQVTNGGSSYMNKTFSPLEDIDSNGKHNSEDIELKQALQFLKESEQRYNALFEHNPECTFLLDLDGKYIDVNSAAEKLTGYQREELLEMTFAPLFAPEELDKVYQHFERAIGGEAQYFEVTLINRQKKQVELDVCMFPMIVNHTITGAYGIATDITDSKRSEQEKNMREARIKKQNKTLLDIATSREFIDGDLKILLTRITETVSETIEVDRVGVWLLNGKGSALNCQDMYLKSLKRHFKERDFDLALNPLFFNAFIETRNRILEINTPEEFAVYKLEYLVESGFSSVLFSPIILDGAIIGFISYANLGNSREWTIEDKSFASSVSDMVALAIEKSEHKKTADALKESAKRLRTLINSLPDFVIFKDSQGTWIEANDVALKLFQLENINYHCKKASELAEFTKSYHDVLLNCEESDEKTWDQGMINRFEEIVPQSDGTTKIFDTIKVPIFHSDGSRKGIVIIGRDITDRKKTEQELAVIREQLESFFNNTADSISIIDLENNTTLRVNDAFTKIFGFTKEEVTLENIAPEHLVAERRELMQRVSSGEQIAKYETIAKRKDGTLVDVSLTLSPVRDPNGNVTAVSIITRDITDKKLAKERLHQSEERFRALVQNASDIFGIVNKDRQMTYLSSAIERILGYKPEDYMENYVQYVHPDDIPNLHKAFEEVYSAPGKTVVNELRIMHVDGSWRDIELIRTNMLHEPGINGIVVNFRDITEYKRVNRQIHYMAYHDSLTELSNRRMFDERLVEELNQAKLKNQILSLMFLDMDRFKFINDSLGHPMGDNLLKEIAKRLTRFVRNDDILARLGGDEFAFIFLNTNRDDTLEIAQEIINEMQKPFYIDSFEFHITTSIGISIFPYDGEDCSTLIKNADAALYRAKEKGKNKYQIYKPGINDQSYKAFRLINDLYKAIDQKELFVYYQPRIHLETGEIRSAEALLRWNHPNWGNVPPTEFIPLAEESGLIVDMNEWVLREACKQNKEWQKSGLPPIRVSVNFSAKQFRQKDLTRRIIQILDETELDPTSLEIEITESTIMKNEEMVTKTISDLRQIGVKISIDDFGTGYSSLNYLKRFPVDTIKIDKSFIANISELHEDYTITKAIITLAHNLKMTVVAEGVETEAQKSILKNDSCDEIQGFLYSPPVSPHEFEKLLSQRRFLNTSEIIEGSASVVQNYDPPYSTDLVLQNIGKTATLSPREQEILSLMIEGLPNRTIAEKLFISEHTVKNYMTKIFRKLGATDRANAIALVYKFGLQKSE